MSTFFQENYHNNMAVTWQYFADPDGHYIQYPANDRSCDHTLPPISNDCDTVDSPLFGYRCFLSYKQQLEYHEYLNVSLVCMNFVQIPELLNTS